MRFGPDCRETISWWPVYVVIRSVVALEQFHFEIALLTRRRQPPRSGVDSGENHAFRQNDTLKHGVFQKQNALRNGHVFIIPWVECLVMTIISFSMRNVLICFIMKKPFRFYPKRHFSFAFKLVGMKGFEPSTPWTPFKCAPRLRYIPTREKIKQFHNISNKKT